MKWFAVLLALFISIENVDSRGVMELYLHKFRNLDGKLENGEFCDRLNECDPYFVITPYLNKKALRKATTLISENTRDVVFPITSNGLPRPIRFPFLTPYKNELDIKVQVLDEDFAGSDTICRLDFTIWDIAVNRMFNTTIFGCSRTKFLKLSIRVLCSEYYFGTDCATYCLPTKFYNCDPSTGAKMCVPGYKGENCTEKINPTPKGCSSAPCQNGGRCVALGSTSYKCLCSSKFTGKNCETEIKPTQNPCDSQPCKNGGKCSTDGSLSYKCNCTDSFTGKNCETELDPCYHHRNLSAKGRTPSDFIDPEGPFRNDHNLKENWYRVTGARSGVLSSRCSALYTCGTKYPIHLPTEIVKNGTKTISAHVCVASCVDCCHMRMDILVKSCQIKSDEFFVYKLRAPLSNEMGYCVE